MKRIVHPPVTKADIDQFWSRKFNITSFLFDKQLAFVEDPSPFKVAVCSRRAGKTIACAAHLIHTAINTPESTNLYITLSGTSGKRIIWKEFKSILKKFGLPAKLNEIELSITFPNDSVIYVAGAKDTSEIEKFRGLAMKLVYIDECQSFREYLKELIDDIIGPALMDYAGSLCLIGTPGPIPDGYFYECSVPKPPEVDADPEEEAHYTWSCHHWTFWDNPHIPVKANTTHDKVFKREMRRRGITDYNEPSVQREWFGQWKLDRNSLVLQYDKSKNDFTHLPPLPGKQYGYIMGIDVGYKDADAIAILAYSDNSPETFLIEEVITTKQGITELVDQIKVLQKKYDISKMVMDMGALGKKIGEEMISRYQIPVEAADKTRKMENLALLNDALRTGHFKARHDSRFTSDSYKIEIDRDKSKPDRLVISDRFHSDIADAVLYAFKCSPAYAWEPVKPKGPKYGTKEWAEQQSHDMFQAELDGLMQENDEFNRLYGIKD